MPFDDLCQCTMIVAVLPMPIACVLPKVDVPEGWMIIPKVAAQIAYRVPILNSCVSIHGVKLKKNEVWIDSAIN